MKTYIPNPDKPCEADEINHHLKRLYQCNKNGAWDMEGVLLWLKVELVQVADAADVMAGYFEDMFPGRTIGEKKEEAA